MREQANSKMWRKIRPYMDEAEYLSGYASARAIEYVIRDGLNFTQAGKLMNLGPAAVKHHLNEGLAQILRVKLKCAWLPSDRSQILESIERTRRDGAEFYGPIRPPVQPPALFSIRACPRIVNKAQK